MGYTSNFMAGTLSAIEDFQMTLSDANNPNAIVNLFWNDSNSLLSAAQHNHNKDFQGDTADALLNFATAYQNLVAQNIEPLTTVATKCVVFSSEIQTACSTFDAAMPPGSNAIVDVVFEQQLLTPAEVLCSNSRTYSLYDVDPITPAVNTAYQIVLSQAISKAGEGVPQSMMYEIQNQVTNDSHYKAMQQEALAQLKSWASSIASAHGDWQQSMINADNDLPPAPAINGITADPQSYMSQFDMLGAQYGVADYYDLSAQDQSDAEWLYTCYADVDPGLSLGFIQKLMIAGFNADQISILLESWNSLTLSEKAMWAYNAAQLAAALGGYAMGIKNYPDYNGGLENDPMVRTEQVQLQSILQTTGQGSGGDMDITASNISWIMTSKDDITVVRLTNGTERWFGPGDKLPPVVEKILNPGGQRWIQGTRWAKFKLRETDSGNTVGGTSNGSDDGSGDGGGDSTGDGTGDFPDDPFLDP